MYSESDNPHRADDLHIAIVVSRYHAQITQALCDGACEAFSQAGGREDRLLIVPAPGAFDLTAIAAAILRDRPIHGLVALGCVIAGETTHDQFINQSVTQGLTSLILETGRPIGFGLLTCRSIEQARARAGGAGGDKGNKGTEAMNAVIASISTIQSLRRSTTTPSGEIT